MTKIGLAESAGVSARIITSYESGLATPSDHTLSSLAEATKFPIGFFMRSDIELIGPNAASFRALSKMTAGQAGMVRAAGSICVEINEWISERFELPEPALPSFESNNTDPESVAIMVRSQWGLGTAPVPNLVHLLESKGVRVFSLARESREVGAYSFWHGGIPFVCLNTDKTAEHGRFDAAHELGHLLLHREHNPVRGRQEEHEANLFASAFLMPDEETRARAPRRLSWSELIEIKKYWNVSAAALNYRLGKGLGHITEWNYRDLCIEISRFGRSEEPDPGPREVSQLLKKVFVTMNNEGTLRRDIARDIGIRLDELDSLAFGLVLLATDGRKREKSPARAHLRVIK